MTTPDPKSLAAEIQAAIAELADGSVYPDLIEAVDRLATLASEQARDAGRWISVEERLPQPRVTVHTLSREKRSDDGWAHSIGSWNDDPDDNSRPDARMFKRRTDYWLEPPPLPPNPFAAIQSTTAQPEGVDHGA